jgi:dTDP-4-dehydrorhamnose 3,5-epimerase
VANHLSIPDVSLITPPRLADSRGYFSETFNLARASAAGMPAFIQDNESLSLKAGTIRGLHFQAPPRGQAKLVRCVRGSVFDVAVDIRHGSPTFGRHVSAHLSAENGAQLLIPVGFAHGFCSMEPNSLVQYKVDAPYSPAHDFGLIWNDPDLAIEWPAFTDDFTLSSRDLKFPALRDLPKYFAYDAI